MPLAFTIESPHGAVGLIHAQTPDPDWGRALEMLSTGCPYVADIALLGFETMQEETRARARPVEGLRALVHGQPANPFPREERVEVRVAKTPYVRFDGNDYSVPHRFVGRTLVVSATLKTVRVLHATTVLATHRRSFDRGQQIEDPTHIETLERDKRNAREHRATDRLHHAAPSAKALFAAAAKRHHHLGVLARGLIELLNAHGPVALERAIAAALQADAAHLAGVRHLIDQQRQQSDRPPPLPLALRDEPSRPTR